MHDVSDSCCSFWIIYAFSFNPLRFMLWYTLMLLYSLSVGPSLWQSIWCYHTWVFHPLIVGTTWNISFYPFFYSPSRASNFWNWQFHLYLPCLFLFLLSFFSFFSATGTFLTWYFSPLIYSTWRFILLFPQALCSVIFPFYFLYFICTFILHTTTWFSFKNNFSVVYIIDV